MSINPITISPDDKISDVVKIFEKNRIGSVFVVQSGKLVGIVTRTMIKNRDPRYSQNISEIMSTNVYTIHPDADVKEAERKIFRQRINGLAVVESNHLCGIITRYDLQTRARNFLETDDEKLKAIFNTSDRVKTQYSDRTYARKPSDQQKPIHKNVTAQHTNQSNVESFIETFFAAVIIFIIGGSFLSNLIFPVILIGVHPNMQYIIGNPKPMYFYDIDSSCNREENNIVSALDYFSRNTGIKFVRLPPPFALLLGNIEYSCGEGFHTPGAIGESEGGMVGVSYFIVAWNKVTLLDTSSEVVSHETLHSMGFEHSQDPTSIMYPIMRGYPQIDSDIVDFLKTFYVNDPFAYLNILTLNMFAGGFLILIIIGLFSRK
jgi:hypothetical protein